MDVKISAKKKSGNVIAYRKGDRGSLVVCYDPIVLHGYNQVILATRPYHTVRSMMTKNTNKLYNLLVKAVLYARLSSESKSVMISKTYQKEKGGSSEE
jgi:hypothetical protein